MKKLMVLALLVGSTSVLAAANVRLEVPVTYHPNAGVVQAVRDECRIEEMLAEHVGAALEKRNPSGIGTVAVGADTSGDAVLRLRITHILGVGGGAWSGPKAITVTAELLEDGKVARQTKINRWSMGGVFGAFKGTCTILERSAVAIGKDMQRWVRDPSYRIREEAPPKEVAKEAVPEASGGDANTSKMETPKADPAKAEVKRESAEAQPAVEARPQGAKDKAEAPAVAK